MKRERTIEVALAKWPKMARAFLRYMKIDLTNLQEKLFSRWRKEPVLQRAATIPSVSDPINKKLLEKGRPASKANFQGTLGTNKIISSLFAAGKRNPVNMIELFARWNPDVSQAVWNFLRMVNPGYTIEVVFADDLTTTDEEGLAILNQRSSDEFGLGFYGRDYGGGLSALMNTLIYSLLTQGAVGGELEINDTLDDVLDWCPVDPRYITINKDTDTGHLTYSVWVRGVEVPLLPEQFRFVPLDPTILNPYGRGPMDPSLESVFFQTEVLRDIKAVAHAQAYPKFHITLLEEIVRKHIPARFLVVGQEEAALSWMNSYLTAVTDQYNNIEADDAFVTFDMVESKGIAAGTGMFRIDALVKIVEQQVISSTKQLPILLGRMDGSGLAHGSVQWQIFAKTIESIREPVAKLASWWCTQTLRVMGRPSLARVVFPTLRVQDRVKEAQAESMEIANSIAVYNQGWEDQDTLAMKHTGHVAVEDEPLASQKPPEPVVITAPIDMEEGDAEEAGDTEALFITTARGAELFKSLPPLFRRRFKAEEGSVNGQMDVRRSAKFVEMEAEKGAPDDDDRVLQPGENGRHVK